VAWTVRSTASRSSEGVLGRFAMGLSLGFAAVPLHIRPATELAERVLLPADPHRALGVAQELLEGPKMFNHSHGLWGYTGTAADGAPLTIQATGLGGPSAAVVAEELIELGARRLVRVGTCAALVPELELGALIAPQTVLPADGTSAALGADGALAPAPGLLERLTGAGARPVTVVSTDLYYDAREDRTALWIEKGVVAVDMEAAAILQVAARRGVEAACVLGVTGTPGPKWASAEQVEQLGLRLGALGYAALADGAGVPASRARPRRR
jgi:uridine phosphorylase